MLSPPSFRNMASTTRFLWILNSHKTTDVNFSFTNVISHSCGRASNFRHRLRWLVRTFNIPRNEPQNRRFPWARSYLPKNNEQFMGRDEFGLVRHNSLILRDLLLFSGYYPNVNLFRLVFAFLRVTIISRGTCENISQGADCSSRW